MHRKPKIKKLTKQQKMLANKQKRENMYKGFGIYIFENNTNADLVLPKLTLGNQKIVPPKGRFRGDSFFLNMVKNNSLKLVEVIQSEDEALKNSNKIIDNLGDNMENKLILDQPAMVTTQGTIEHVQITQCCNTNKNENLNISEEEKNKDVLLVEDPVGTIEIIND